MDIKLYELIDAQHTGYRMHQMVVDYYWNMAPYASLSLIEMYDKIKSIPYQEDPPGMELIKRPQYTMEQIGPGGDCDDKAIAMASWARVNSLEYNFIAVGRKEPGKKYARNEKILLTHVFSIIRIDGTWIIADATYSQNTLGQVLGGYDRIEVLGPQNAQYSPKYKPN